MRAGTLIRCARREAVVALVCMLPARAGEVERHDRALQPRSVGLKMTRGQVGQGSSPQVGVDLFDDGVPAVLGLGLQHGDRGVGEHGVVAVGVEQHPLPTGLGARLQAFHAVHDQPGGDLLSRGPADERGVVDIGDLRVGDPPLLGLVEDGVGVLDWGPRLGVDGGYRGLHRPVLPGGDRETGPPARPRPPQRGSRTSSRPASRRGRRPARRLRLGRCAHSWPRTGPHRGPSWSSLCGAGPCR